MKKLLNESFAYVLITVAYDQSKFSGPPRSVPENEMNRLFGSCKFLKKIMSRMINFVLSFQAISAM